MECHSALCYHSPTATERETKPVTVERSAGLSDEYSAIDAESQRQLQSLRRATSSTHQRPRTGWPTKSKPLPNDQKIVLNRIEACH